MWWEKTVEYLFVVTYLNRKVLMAPLDGDYEAGGDLVANRDDKWVLIEFKRNAGVIDSEIQKFAEPSVDSFNNAKAVLGDSDGHHLLIFGEHGHDEPIELKALSYFRRQPVAPRLALGCGVNQEEFNSYLADFLFFKFGEEEETKGGRSLNYSTVVAVNTEGQVTHCEGLANYCERLNLGPDLSPDPTPTSTHGYEMSGPC